MSNLKMVSDTIKLGKPIKIKTLKKNKKEGKENEENRKQDK